MKPEFHSHNPDNEKSRFKYFIIVSVLVHISLFCFLLLAAHFSHAPAKSELVEVSFVDIKKENYKPIAPTAIVDSDSERANNELSENAKYLSEKNNSEKKETKAKISDKFHNAKKMMAAQALNPAENKTAVKAEPKSNKSKLFDNSFDAYASLTKREASAKQQQQLRSHSDDESTTNDNLAKVEDDLMTRLNTKEYKYYGYYSRIKKQLNQWWVPKVQQKFTKMLRQGRTIASEDNKITKLVIILNDSGRLIAVQILAESGIRDLDEAAIEAFRSAAPFPNPPKGMVDSEGKVKIRWDCVVES